ncbi:TPA: hypothetical protein DCQ22_03995 [Candidatus Nomurabacteria bacterium]|nr:hypothetical protein [Candidatus Nomurabacteria bacterium]
MDKMKIVKWIIRIVAQVAVGQVIDNVLVMNTPVGLSTVKTVLTKTGGFVISSMVADKSSDYVMNEINRMIPEKTVEEPKSEKEETK